MIADAGNLYAKQLAASLLKSRAAGDPAGTPAALFESPSPNALNEFNDRLARVLPGKLGLFKVEDRSQINSILVALGDNPHACNLRWTNGLMDADIREVRHLPKNMWLVGTVEGSIRAMWVNKDAAVQRNFIVLECAPSPSFGYGQTPDGWEEANWYVDRYISPDEASDGYAMINGRIVKLEQPIEARLRCIQRHFLFLSTSESYLEQAGNQDMVMNVNDALQKTDTVNPSALEPLRRLRSGS